MNVTCKELRDRAWVALSGENKYWYAVLLLFVYGVINSVGSFTFGLVTLLTLPMLFAYDVAILRLSREGEQPQVESLFKIYSENLEKAFLVPFLMMIFVSLWSLLFVIPGIIMAYAYSMAVYVSYDNPELTSLEAIKESRRLMNGHKWDLFVLDLSFIGWILLCCLTFGIGFFFLAPYIETAHAEFYRELVKGGGTEK